VVISQCLERSPRGTRQHPVVFMPSTCTRHCRYFAYLRRHSCLLSVTRRARTTPTCPLQPAPEVRDYYQPVKMRLQSFRGQLSRLQGVSRGFRASGRPSGPPPGLSPSEDRQSAPTINRHTELLQAISAPRKHHYATSSPDLCLNVGSSHKCNQPK
jgi:hypothetical protein